MGDEWKDDPTENTPLVRRDAADASGELERIESETERYALMEPIIRDYSAGRISARRERRVRSRRKNEPAAREGCEL
jgi:hypothetical protein